MKFRKITAFILAAILLLGIGTVGAFAANDKLSELQEQFEFGVGPETEGYAIDYRYYSPVKDEDDTTKYPVVVWLHGMGNGGRDGEQVEKSDIALWAREDYQSRFKKSGGAFIFAPRSLEEKELYWDDCLIYPLRAAIDSFIEENRENVDVSRIYVGGYSMGGKMTFKMAVAYPEMFAAAFPICPAWAPGEDATAKISDMPVWLTSGVRDNLVNYYAMVMPAWKNVLAQTNVPESCRFSTLSITAYANGIPTLSPHHSWYAVTSDMFSSRNGDYPFMKTVDGNGKKVELTYPDGMISWLSGIEGDFDGAKATDEGNSEARTSDAMNGGFSYVISIIKNYIEYIISLFKFW